MHYSFVLLHASAAMIPVETAGRKLDDDSWDRREPTVEVVDMGDAYSVTAVDA